STWGTQSLCGFNRNGEAKVYSYVPPSTGTYTITITSNSLSDYSALMWSTGCGEPAGSWNCISDVAAAATGTVSVGASWTAGNTYYILWRGETTGLSGSLGWRIDCLPPANNDCAGALPVSSFPY